MEKVKAQYPFECKVCKKKVLKKTGKKNTKAHRKQKCTKYCDGIIRDIGGFPVDPLLRHRYKAAMKLKRQANKILLNLDQSDPFYISPEWRTLRYQAFSLYGNFCAACKTKDKELHVDHIKPRSKYPELALDINNLQILCIDCNFGKGNRDSTRFLNHSSNSDSA